jgi:hypothetical protein
VRGVPDEDRLPGGDVVEDDTRLLVLLGGIIGAAATDPARARSARRAARRWLVADTSARLADASGSESGSESGHASGGESGVRAALARRLDEALRSAPLHQRTVLRARVAALRAQLARLRGAGVERALAAAAQLGNVDAMLGALEQLATAGERSHAPNGRARLLALLLLTAGE